VVGRCRSPSDLRRPSRSWLSVDIVVLGSRALCGLLVLGGI
jgi:hypothetical protein